MSLLVVGSVAFDDLETPFGKREHALGGSATYFSLSASRFHPVRIVAVVGEDFGPDQMRVFDRRPIDLAGLSRVKGLSFHWKGAYGYDLNEAKTLATDLNVFAHFRPDLPPSYRESKYLFLGNIDPNLQLDVLQQVKRPALVACDTMNFWINGKRDALWNVLQHIDILIINDGEARALGEDTNLVKVAKKILARGPKHLIVKRGEYGVLMFNDKQVFGAPAFPLDDVRDPTGAGDTFAGGFLGYLAATGNRSPEAMRQAIIFGSVMASFTVEAFSLDRLRILDYKEIEARFKEFKRLTHFEDIEA